MICLKQGDKRYVKYLRGKYNNLKIRVNKRPSYIRNGIKNEFTWPAFKEFCIDNDLKYGQHLHRPDRLGNYCKDNLIFVSQEEHNRITALEKRKLSPLQEKELLELIPYNSQRKLAKHFNVTQPTICNTLKRIRNK